MRTLVLCLAALCVAVAVQAADPQNLYVSPDLKIAIIVPVDKTATPPSYQVAQFWLPPVEGFSANVNIQKQQFGGTMAQYDQISGGQFEKGGLTVLQRTVTEKDALWELKGTIQGRDMHFYVRAAKQGNYVLLVTATAMEKSWPAQSAELVKSVKSFTVE